MVGDKEGVEGVEGRRGGVGLGAADGDGRGGDAQVPHRVPGHHRRLPPIPPRPHRLLTLPSPPLPSPPTLLSTQPTSPSFPASLRGLGRRAQGSFHCELAQLDRDGDPAGPGVPHHPGRIRRSLPLHCPLYCTVLSRCKAGEWGIVAAMYLHDAAHLYGLTLGSCLRAGCNYTDGRELLSFINFTQFNGEPCPFCPASCLAWS